MANISDKYWSSFPGGWLFTALRSGKRRRREGKMRAELAGRELGLKMYRKPCVLLYLVGHCGA